MTKLTTFIIAVLVVLILGFYMVSFQVRYDEVAVLTTFEKAVEPVVLSGTILSVRELPANGVLQEDAAFDVKIGETNAERVVVPAAATVDNAEASNPLQALQADLQTALAQSPVGGSVDADLSGSLIILRLKPSAQGQFISIPYANDVSSQSLFAEHVASEGDLYRQPGLYFKAPWPVQKVTRYSKRLHILEDQLQEQQTSDGNSVIVKTFVAWRIADPYTFWKELQTVARAEEILRGQLSSVNGVIGEYPFSQLVNPDESRIALAEIEDKAANRIRQQIGPSGYGIEIEAVGIRRLLLPEKVTESVFERMKSGREARAAGLLSQGEAEAGRIRKDAESKRDRILAFAEGRAQEIEALGAKEAAEAYGKFSENEEFAIFLRQMQALEEMLGFNSTFVFRVDELDLLRMFKNGPQIVADPQSGEPRVRAAERDTPEGR